MDKKIKFMEHQLLNLGFGNTVVAQKVVAILSPNSAPMKRVKDEAKEEKRLVDVTHGRKTRAIIITQSNHVILSAIQAETVSNRFESLMNQEDEPGKESGKESGKDLVKNQEKE